MNFEKGTKGPSPEALKMFHVVPDHSPDRFDPMGNTGYQTDQYH